jgi:hypothetical protein
MAGNVAINGDDEFEGGRLLVATDGRVWAASRKVMRDSQINVE